MHGAGQGSPRGGELEKAMREFERGFGALIKGMCPLRKNYRHEQAAHHQNFQQLFYSILFYIFLLNLSDSRLLIVKMTPAGQIHYTYEMVNRISK